MRRWLNAIWNIYATASGLAIISFGLAYLILDALSPVGPVVQTFGDVRLLTPEVPYRGELRYVSDLERLQSCPGSVVTTLQSDTNHGPPATVTFRRPVISVDIKRFDGALRIVELPESVFPGTWKLVSGVESQCPTFARFDRTAEFSFKVLGP